MDDLQANLIKLFHLGGELPIYDNDPVPTVTDGSQLADPAVLKQFQDVVKKIIALDAGQVALLGRRILEDALLPQFPQFKSQSPGRYNEYLRLIALLKFVNLQIRPLPEIRLLVSNYLTEAVKEGMDVKRKLQDVLLSYDDITLLGTIAESLGKSFMDSKSVLGDNPIALAGQPQGAPPTLSNWLKDYLSFRRYASFAEERAAASFNRVAYFNRSANVRKLSEIQKKLLLSVFKLYDWLRFGEDSLDTSRGVFAGPKGRVSDMDLAGNQPAPKLSVAAPRPVPTASPPPPTAPAQPKASKPMQSAPYVPRKPVNVQDLLNPKSNPGMGKAAQTGVFGAQGSSVNVEALAKEAQAKRREEEAEIAKKLEELKKRRKN